MSVLQRKPMSVPCNILPGSCSGRTQHHAGEGLQLLPACPMWGELVGFTACGCEATASAANLRRDGICQPQDLLPAPSHAPGLSQGLTTLIIPWGW